MKERRARRRPPTSALRPFLRRVGLGAGALAAVAAAVWVGPFVVTTVRDHPYFAVTQIELRGAQTLVRDDVLDAANLHAGMSLWLVSPGATRERIEALAWVDRAHVRREFPNRVIVTLAERTPMAIAVVEGMHYVDRSGRVLGPVGPQQTADLPFITGLNGSHLDGTGVPVLRRALRLIRLCERRECGGGVSEVHLDPARGLVLVPRNVPVPVVIGWGGLKTRLERLERVLTAWAGQEDRVAAVDVTFRRSVVVKLREGQPAAKPQRRAKGTAI